MAKFYYGGQAVIEGVMMRGRYHMAVAVREPDGNIRMHSERLKGALYNSRVAKIPFVRGIALLGETLQLGMRSLLWSAEVTASAETGQKVEFGKGATWGLIGGALLFATGLFFIAPLLITALVDQLHESPLVSNLVEGGFRLAILLGYMMVISRMKEIRRVFEYHGAEHKAVNAHESGDPLDVEHVQRYPVQHVRCGTSFMLTLVVVSIFVFAIFGEPPMEWRIASRIVLLPVLAAIAYEVLKFAAAHASNPIVRVLYRPNLSLQSFTTRQPDDQQVEVAIVALEKVLAADAETVRQLEAAKTREAHPVGIPAIGQA